MSPVLCDPSIFRKVWLMGVVAVMGPKTVRLEAWRRLAAELDRTKLAVMTTTIRLEDAIESARSIVDGKIRGRIVIEIG